LSADEPSPASQETSFRERALGGDPNPLERIDHLFHQTSKRIWLGVLGVAMLLAAGVVWTAVATQAITAEGAAVIVPPQGIFSAGDFHVGLVSAVLVKEGTRVRKGQPLAEVQASSGQHVPVPSPAGGTVIAVEVRVGDPTNAGVSMFRIAPIHQQPMAIALFPAARISQFQIGQKAAITIHGISPAQYGTAVGRVSYIAQIPISEHRLRQLTGDSSLVGLPASLGPLKEVRIALQRADTPSGLAWTDGNGPPDPPPVGDHAVASVTVDRETLIGKAFG
jgi:Biotin-requiring enzyme